MLLSRDKGTCLEWIWGEEDTTNSPFTGITPTRIYLTVLRVLGVQLRLRLLHGGLLHLDDTPQRDLHIRIPMESLGCGQTAHQRRRLQCALVELVQVTHLMEVGGRPQGRVQLHRALE